MKYSCIRYVISPSEGINDNVWTDPRTGEIISANIYICHNLPMQIQRDRLLQTAAYDKSARTLTLNEEDFGRCAYCLRRGDLPRRDHEQHLQ